MLINIGDISTIIRDNRDLMAGVIRKNKVDDDKVKSITELVEKIAGTTDNLGIVMVYHFMEGLFAVNNKIHDNITNEISILNQANALMDAIPDKKGILEDTISSRKGILKKLESDMGEYAVCIGVIRVWMNKMYCCIPESLWDEAGVPMSSKNALPLEWDEND